MGSNPCVSCREHCCIGDYATFVTLGDVRRIAKFTGRPPDEFAKYDDICADPEGQEELMEEKDHSYFEYDKSGKVLQLKAKDNGECIFLKDMKCTIYPARPLVCRIFPIGFRKEGDSFRMLVEEEDISCPIAADGSLSGIFRFLGYDKEKANSLIKQFLEEVEEYRKNIALLGENKLADLI